jgi:N-acetylmuramoyl-L-alanine amidase
MCGASNGSLEVGGSEQTQEREPTGELVVDKLRALRARTSFAIVQAGTKASERWPRPSERFDEGSWRKLGEEESMAVIVVDPGHGETRTVGGSSPNNATGPAGTKEKTLTLAVGLAARSALAERGHASS